MKDATQMDFEFMDNSVNRHSVFMEGLPMSPTSNHLHKTIYRSGRPIRVRNQTYTDYANQMKFHYLSNVSNYLSSLQMIKQWLSEGFTQYQFNAVFYFKKERIICKNGKPKRLDLSNRIKALHDTVLEMFNLDDSYIFRQYEEKAITSDEEESITIEIFPITQ